MRQWVFGLGLASIVSAGALWACSGNDGAPGAAGQPGAAGAAGAAGPAGPAGMAQTGATGDAGSTIVVSETAKHGLAISPVPVSLAGLTGDQIEEVGQGSYLVNAIGDCTGCHTSDPTKFLAGGTPFGGGGAPFTVISRNLTPDPATGLASNIKSVDAFVNAMQTGADYHGVAAGGSPTKTLVVMPWETFRWMTTADLKAIYAYLKLIPAVANAITDDVKTTGAPGTLPTSYGDGDQASAVALPPAMAPDPGNTLRGLAINPLSEVTPPTLPGQETLFGRGSYLVNAIADCNGCHTNPTTTTPATSKINTAAYLTGGMEFDTPPPLRPMVKTVRAASANLTGEVHGFFNLPGVSFATFLTLITQGVHAEDAVPTPLAFPMPWQTFRNMQLADLEAIYTYMSAVATQYGATTLTGVKDKVIPAPALFCDATHACPVGTCSGATGECLVSPCATATVTTDCGTCQTCSMANGGTCQAPGAGPPCSY